MRPCVSIYFGLESEPANLCEFYSKRGRVSGLYVDCFLSPQVSSESTALI